MTAVCIAAAIGPESGGAQSTFTSYDGYHGYSYYNETPFATPRWTAELDRPDWDDPGASVAIGNGKVYFVKEGSLIGVDASTGRTLWTYGGQLHGPLTLEGESAYVFSSDGKLHQVNADTGKANWTYQVNASPQFNEMAYASIVMAEHTVYIAYVGGAAALEADTGKQIWRNDTFEMLTGLHIEGEFLLLNTAESGAITVGTTYRLDKKTGEKLWRLPGSHDGIMYADNAQRGYFQDTWLFQEREPFGLAIDIVDLQTGEIVDRRQYVPIADGQDPFSQRANAVVMIGEQLYVRTADNDIENYHIEADTDAPPALRIEGGRDEWIAGPYDGKLFFRDNGGLGTVYARKLIDRTRVNYEGLDNPVGRLDLIDNGLFVGQTDGEVYALNVSTGKALFRYQTAARGFGPFRTKGNTLLVQAENKLYAFDLPQELRAAAANAPSTASYPTAQADLVIDGTAQRFEPSPVMIDNRMFVPLRALFQAVGAKVDFDNDTQQVHVTYGDRAFTLKEGAPFATVGGEQRPMAFAPALVNGAVYVPLREVGGLLGVGVLWVDATRTVEITTK